MDMIFKILLTLIIVCLATLIIWMIWNKKSNDKLDEEARRKILFEGSIIKGCYGVSLEDTNMAWELLNLQVPANKLWLPLPNGGLDEVRTWLQKDQHVFFAVIINGIVISTMSINDPSALLKIHPGFLSHKFTHYILTNQRYIPGNIEKQ